MAEYHAGTDVEIPDGVATSGFRCAIPNTKRYMKKNGVKLGDVATASYGGDFDALEVMLSTGDEKSLFNGDLNAHATSMTCLHLAALAGQTECVELLLKAKADPHVRENVAYGCDPMEGNSALDLAKKNGWDDCAELLEQAEKKHPYGWYVPAGPKNNAKQYGCWEWGKAPAKDWYMSRPGAAQNQGLDPAKYGVKELAEDFDEEDFGAIAMSVSAEKPLPIGLLFPNQGSEYVKMMSSVKDIPAVKDMLAKARSILNFDVLEVCLKGPEEKLTDQSVAQPAMFVACLAGLEKLRTEREEAVTRCQSMCGPSLGQYTALCAAGVFTFEQGLELLKIRGQAMGEAAKIGKQATVSVAGLEKFKINELCEEAVKAEGGSAVCQIAHELFPKGFSIAGTEVAIQALKVLCDKAGALQAKVTKSGGGFHTPLMQSAQDKVAKVLDAMLPKMSPPTKTVYMSITGMPVRPGTPPKEIVELLKKEITAPVLWEACARAMIKDGVSEVYEVGPMKQLKAMMKRIDPKIWNSTQNIEV